MPAASSPTLAVAVLGRLRELSGHEFWSDDLQLVTGDHLDATALTGHGQVTNAHLLALTRAKGGRLVTFDRGLRALPQVGHDVVLLES